MNTKLIPLHEIKVDLSKNPRKDIHGSAISELQDSIKAVRELSGTHKTLLQPVVVRAISDPEYKYELRVGFRRYTALQQLYDSNPVRYPWANKIPAVIDDHDPDDEETASDIAFALIENLQRTDMTPVDEANALHAMLDDFNLKQKDIAAMLGKSKGWVSQRLKLSKLSPAVQTAVAEEKIGHAAARQLSRIEDKKAQEQTLKDGLKEGWQEDDWKSAVNQKRRKTTSSDTDDTTSPSTTTETQAYTVKRAPGEIKKMQEFAEFEASETPYEQGVSNALLWVLGLLNDPLAEENLDSVPKNN